jgi:mRNA interferase MazF
MTSFDRGDVVLVDLGTVAKIRPCVVVSVRNPDAQRNMCIVVPLTTEIRGGECEVAFPKPPWLRSESVINVLGIVGVDVAKVLRRLGKLPQRNLEDVFETLLRAVGLMSDRQP